MTSKRSTTLKTKRVGGTLAAALCALALTACGTERAGGEATAGAAMVAKPTATPTEARPDPMDDPGLTAEEQEAAVAFMSLVIEVAAPCEEGSEGFPVAPPSPEPERPGQVETQGPPPRPADSGVPVPLEDAPPPADTSWNFERVRQEVELGDVEKCAALRHGRRIAKALDGTGDPTATHVEKALGEIGYNLDYRLHGPTESNGKIEFTLDLRGGELCLDGTYDGTRTTFDPYGVHPAVYCTDVKRHA
ncbi:hypothetical protein [Streptomyces sp. NBC_00572]|uniref:hypothetical protein n=1 Tax=Streptomyces sp. NBC_00572 TaxID=2903664 RepID=UPI00224D13A0|nr:hypothetical protein [Streptomyces sp. NBC_00572]MCX4981293.1 hypothetical protein [Streptomyces sp. NBC_00572]